MIDTEKRQKLYERIKNHSGAIKEIAERTGKHRNWVSRILLGKAKGGLDVLEEAAKVLGEREAKEARAQKIIDRALQLVA